jgi:phosphoglucomutase
MKEMDRVNTQIRVLEQYQLWINDPAVDAATKAELKQLANQPKEIEDRFYRDLQFGTGGLRGVIGAGTNRMNLYTVARATQGLAQYVNKSGKMNPSVVIAYELRRYWPATGLKLTCSSRFDPHRSCPFQLER